jgi:hypothetical protein
MPGRDFLRTARLGMRGHGRRSYPDFVVGKRFYSHQESTTDPDPYGAPVLYSYRTVRNKNAPGGAEFVPELIHNASGAGSQIVALDLNKDGINDIATAASSAHLCSSENHAPRLRRRQRDKAGGDAHQDSFLCVARSDSGGVCIAVRISERVEGADRRRESMDRVRR